jgi:hypothetical protein
MPFPREDTMATITVQLPHVPSYLADAEISAVLGSPGPEISDCVAVTIASWWQSPGTIGRHLAALASGAPVQYGDLADDIHATYNGPGLSRQDRQDLDVLSTWALNRTDANRRDYSA